MMQGTLYVLSTVELLSIFFKPDKVIGYRIVTLIVFEQRFHEYKERTVVRLLVILCGPLASRPVHGMILQP